MRILLIPLLFMSFQNPVFCQEETFRKNTVSLESGIFSRGLFGISYSRKFLKNKFCFISTDAFFGAGISGFYYGIGSALNLGRDEVFFVLGVDGKRFKFEYPESIVFKAYHFAGLAYNPYIGLNLFTPAGLSVKTRFGFMPIYKSRTYDGFFPTLGVSLGYSF